MFERLVTPAWRSVLLLLAVVVPVYAATAEYDPTDLNVDVEAAALPAWNLAVRGTTDLASIDADRHPAAARALARNPWIGSGEEGTFSNRPVGLWAVAVPAYLLSGVDDYRAWPATVTAISLTSLAMVVVLLTLRALVPSRAAWLGAAGLALLTATWPISSSQLWPHGPGQLFAAVALLAAAQHRRALSAVAFAGAGLVRPVTVVMPGAIALLHALRRRWAWAAALGVATLTAIVATVAYNAATFGAPSLSGGYSSGFRENLVGQGVTDYVANLWGFFFSVRHGLAWWTPVLVPAAIGLRHVWGVQPDWVRHGLLAGLAYIAVHARLNRVSGGLPFDYRYPLEPLVLAWPAVVQGTRCALRRSRPLHLATVAAIGVSLALQGLMATTADCATQAGSSEAVCSLW